MSSKQDNISWCDANDIILDAPASEQQIQSFTRCEREYWITREGTVEFRNFHLRDEDLGWD